MRTIIFFLISGSVQAKIIDVNYKLLHYKIDYKDESVLYTSSNVDLSLKKKACNEHILKSFKIQMNKILKEDFSDKYLAHSYSLKIDGIIKYDSLTSSRAQFFAEFHDYFSKMKIEESLSCD